MRAARRGGARRRGARRRGARNIGKMPARKSKDLFSKPTQLTKAKISLDVRKGLIKSSSTIAISYTCTMRITKNGSKISRKC